MSFKKNLRQALQLQSHVLKHKELSNDGKLNGNNHIFIESSVVTYYIYLLGMFQPLLPISLGLTNAAMA